MDHPSRRPLIDELHSRPFPVIGPRSEARFLALRPEKRSARDRAGELAHLNALLQRHGAGAVAEDEVHALRRLGPWWLKWETHTEFVSVLAWRDAGDELPQTPFPEDWLARAPGMVVASVRLTIRPAGDDDAIVAGLDAAFPDPGLAVSEVLDGELVVATDFRPGEGGAMRFLVHPREGTGTQRIGRVVQRLCEIETYRALAMLGLLRSREMAGDLAAVEAELGRISGELAGGAAPARTLDALLAVAGRLAELSARSDFRFSATAAYEALVTERIAVLRERRFQGRQTFREFMMRRFDPAMRTTASTRARLERLSERAMRIGELLRTRVEVDRSADTKSLLESMDRRSDQALKLQHTVEGLSVIAVSYYATGLALYLVGPLVERWHVSKTLAAALIVPVVVLATWWALRRLRERLT